MSILFYGSGNLTFSDMCHRSTLSQMFSASDLTDKTYEQQHIKHLNREMNEKLLHL